MMNSQFTHTHLRYISRRCFSTHTLPPFATVDPYTLNSNSPHYIQNLVGGKWTYTHTTKPTIDPMNGQIIIHTPDTQSSEFQPFIDSMKMVPKSGQHNHFKKPERYQMFGEIFQKAATHLRDPIYFDFFVKCIQRTMPKNYKEAAGEVRLVRNFLDSYCGNSIRFLMRGFAVSGDHFGQQSQGYRWPYGPVAIISPFNFPLEIPGLQLLAALMVGNKPILKSHYTQSLPLEQFIRFLQYCGLSMDEMDYINITGSKMSNLLDMLPLNMLQFTGGSDTATKLITQMKGKVKVEDSGFDWKILGPDVNKFDEVCKTCDNDAYALSGQKCSAQSILFAHQNWVDAGLIDRLKQLAEQRSLEDLSLSPTLSVNNQDIEKHMEKLLSIPNSKLLFGGKPLPSHTHTIPSQYGSYTPTCVSIPISSVHPSSPYYTHTTHEIFGPFQTLVIYTDDDIHTLLECVENFTHHLTAAIVTSNTHFAHTFLGSTCDGTTYVGTHARTTGAPTNHWFGPGGTPTAAGIGSPEAIIHTWTAHREIIWDI